MSTTVNETVTGVFPSVEQATRAIEELQRAGFRDEEIGLVHNRARGLHPTGGRGGGGGHAAFMGSQLCRYESTLA